MSAVQDFFARTQADDDCVEVYLCRVRPDAVSSLGLRAEFVDHGDDEDDPYGTYVLVPERDYEDISAQIQALTGVQPFMSEGL